MYIFLFPLFSGDVSNKRSDDRIAKDKAKSIVENIDMMINYMLERYERISIIFKELVLEYIEANHS